MDKCLSANATVGVTNFVDLRSICVTVRGEKAHITKFRGCTLHPMCGFLDGQEVSAMQIGEAVRRMHAAVRVEDVLQMLKGKSVPDGFHEKVDRMVDDFDEERSATGRCRMFGMSRLFENASSGLGGKFCRECPLPSLKAGARVQSMC